MLIHFRRLLLFLFISGTANAQSLLVDSSKLVTLRIDPEKARGTTVSDVFEEVHFIPLETTNESLFGRINQLGVTKSNYVIYDEDTHAILIFYNDGKYKTKIGLKQISATEENAENISFSGFEPQVLDAENIIRIKTGKNYLDFNLDGQLIKKTILSTAQAAYHFPSYSIGQEKINIKFNRPDQKGSDNYHELILSKDEVVTGRYLPFQRSIRYKDNIGRFGKMIFDTGNPDELLYVGWSTDLNIYKIRPHSVQLVYHIILPDKNSLPADFNSNPDYIGKKQLYFRNNVDAYFQIGNAFQLGNDLFFNLMNSTSGNKSFLYNLKNNTLLAVKKLQPDQLSLYLPVTDGAYDYYGFHLYQGGYLYNSYSSLSMFAFKQQSEHQNIKYSSTLLKYFATQNKKSNPVLVKLKKKIR
jgi:hypothetical protein